MNVLKKKIILTGTMIGLSLCALSFTTYAWISGGEDSVGSVDQLGGAVLQSYFHSGDGSENDPFTITTPWHYENFAKLHYELEGFSTSNYYFELGYKFGSGNARTFYKTDENGVVDFTDSTATTLNLGGEEFAPIGTEENPFLNTLKGNNLTVSNFVVNGDGYHDIGIFGFVGEHQDGTGAVIENVYFSDFTIKTQGASITTHAHIDAVETRAHNDYAHVGYIAGHVVRATEINNVYVNNCTIDGKTVKDRTVDTYGYYGKVEYDHTDGQRQSGNNYSFSLNAKEVHDYFSNNYQNIKDLPLRTRVGVDADDAGRHYADYDFPVEGEAEWANDRAAHPFYDAVSVNTTGTTYTLNGTTTDEYADRTYSLSTLGYQELKTGGKREYRLQYKNDDGELIDLPEELSVEENTPTLDQQYSSGEFMRYQTGANPKWIYQHSDNDKTTMAEAIDFTFNLSVPNSFTCTSTYSARSPSIEEMRAYFYIDGTQVFSTSVSAKLKRTGWLLSENSYEFYDISLTDTSFKYSLKRGLHYYAFFLAFRTNQDLCKFACLYDPSIRVDFSTSGTVRKVFDITQAELNITQEQYESPTFSFSATSYKAQDATTTDSYVLNVDSKSWNKVIPPYVAKTSFEKDVYATDISSGVSTVFVEKNDDLDIHKRTHKEPNENGYKEVFMKNGAIYERYDYETGQVSEQLTPNTNTIYSITNIDNIDAITTDIFYYNGSTFKNDIIHVYEDNGSLYDDSQFTVKTVYKEDQVYFATNTASYFKYDVGNSKWYNMTSVDKFDYWVAENYPPREVDCDKNPVYIGNQLADVNYKFKNIDIVGGNVSFTYIDSIWFIPINLQIISLPPETQNTNIVEYPTTAQIDGAEQFYATQNCPGSIVMYVNNCANALDNVDSQIGHIEFTYANMNYRGQSLINVEVPSFKKGSGNFVDIRTMGRINEGEQAVNFVSTFTGDITESGAKKTSYACLDNKGRMLGVYDINGNPGYGFFKQAINEPADQRYSYTPGIGGFANGTYTKNENGNYVIDQDKIRSIATYVIVLGSNSRSSDNDTYITEIKFDYNAHEGSGGSFGPVGYRDATDTVTDTIINFFFDAPADLNYSIKIHFNKNDSIYDITFSASKEITITIFNYEIDNYSIYFNGSLLADDDGKNMEVNIVNYDPGG